MTSITVRDLPEEVKKALRAQAARNGRSTEAEARQLITNGVDNVRSDLVVKFIEASTTLRGDFSTPERARN